MKKLPFILLFLMGCSKASFDVSPIMEKFYTESVALPAETVDSINTFDHKVDLFAIRYSDALEHYRYPQIKENVKLALEIVANGWDDDINVDFEFGN